MQIFLLFEHEVDDDGRPVSPGTVLNPYRTLPGAQGGGWEQAHQEFGHEAGFRYDEWRWDAESDRWTLRTFVGSNVVRVYSIEERRVVNA